MEFHCDLNLNDGYKFLTEFSLNFRNVRICLFFFFFLYDASSSGLVTTSCRNLNQTDPSSEITRTNWNEMRSKKRADVP